MSLGMSIILAVAMLIGNAFFVGAEFGLVSARRSSIELQAARGLISAKISLKAMEQVSLMLAGAQLGVTLCSLVFGAIGEPLVAHLLVQPFQNMGIPELLIHPVSLIIALMTMVYIHVVIGEMVPKNLALASPVKVALLLIPPLVFIVNLLKPLIIILNAVANGTLKLVGLKPSQEMASSFGRDEVAGFVKESLHEGLLSSKEEQLLSGSLHFDDVILQSIIVPVDKVIATSSKPTPAEIERLTSQTGFSRFPVISKSKQLKGYVHLKDILRIPDNEYDEPLATHLIRPLVCVKIAATLREALEVMQRSGSHLAKVVDDNSLVVGIIALEDVIEELVGEIQDGTRKPQVNI
ncbi:MAG: hemolysin family protein [Candidatus Saccharibacteria bacterium]